MGAVTLRERQCMRCGKPESAVGLLQDVTLAVGGFWRVCAPCLAKLRQWRPVKKKGRRA